MIKHLSMKPTGWFQFGWSAEIAPGAVKPLKYFGEDLVAFRTLEGQLSVLDAHCAHMGAHLGYGGKVIGDRIQCPYHGWEWGVNGDNRLVPQLATTMRKRIRKWAVIEQHECMFLWHDPMGGPPREGWEPPDLFDLPDKPADPKDFYPSVSNQATVFAPGERIHVQAVVENAADSAHFRFSHGAPVDPVLLWFNADQPLWRSSVGFKSPKTGEVTLRTLTYMPGVGLSFTVFDHHAFGRRLILSCTPVDDETSDLRVTYFFPRDPKSPQVMPQHVKDAAKGAHEFYEQDARIWRHQKFVQRPLFAPQDVAGYTALRRWSNQFYEVAGAARGPMQVVEGEVDAG